jgi:FG-GAP repeat protein
MIMRGVPRDARVGLRIRGESRIRLREDHGMTRPTRFPLSRFFLGFASLALPLASYAALPSLVVPEASGARAFERAAPPFAQAGVRSPLDTPQKVVIDDGAQADFFGWAVAVDGRVALVGAYGVTVGVHEQQGLAYVFTEGDGGIWTLAATLEAGDGRPFDTFGSAVALSNGVAAVGAYQADGGIGYVYVFTGSGTHWTETAKLSTGTTADECLGWSLAAGRGVVLAGAPFAVVDGDQTGAVYAFAPVAGVWTQTQKLTASDLTLGDFFGNAIAIDGTTAVIANDGATIGGNLTQGAAYVFENTGGSWTEQAKLVADDGAAFDNFGRSVAISGSTILVGAAYAVIDDNAFQGAVYAFDGSGSDWAQSQKLVASDGTVNTYFGWSLAIRGDSAIVGATSYDDPDAGAAYTFARGDGHWAETGELASGDDTGVDLFGWSVAMSSTGALVGEPEAYVGGNYAQGAAYFYDAPADRIFANGFE